MQGNTPLTLNDLDIAAYPEGLPIVVPGANHDFRSVKATVKKVLKTKQEGIYDEWWSDELTPGEVTEVLVLE